MLHDLRLGLKKQCSFQFVDGPFVLGIPGCHIRDLEIPLYPGEEEIEIPLYPETTMLEKACIGIRPAEITFDS